MVLVNWVAGQRSWVVLGSYRKAHIAFGCVLVIHADWCWNVLYWR